MTYGKAAQGDCKVVIGANFGDEGKGLITDKIVSGLPGRTTVIRYNSSAQAGHTVSAPDGRRHVFHHLGSGSLLGAETMLGRRFVSHPMLLGEELGALRALGVAPELHADPRGAVATPYDILANQACEDARGRGRHGSCGIGFNEAVERSLRPKFRITVADLFDRAGLGARLRAIRDGWLPKRLATLGIAALPAETRALIESEAVIEAFLADVELYLDAVRLVEPGELPATDFVVFEGAQGLALDEDAPGFPHVTRSKTGLANVIEIARETGLERLDVTYVTRCYLTRHGAGPLAGEYARRPYPGIVDPTNSSNAYQGSLRFADLDLRALGRRIAADLDFRADGLTARAGLAVTCLDQVGARVRVLDGGRREVASGEVAPLAARAAGLPLRYVSHGPTRDDVSAVEPDGAVDRGLARAS